MSINVNVNDTLDRTVRDVAAAAGHTNLSPEVVHDVKVALSHSYIDSVLDGVKLAADEDDTAEDDIVSSSEDDTEEEKEQKKKNRNPTSLTVASSNRSSMQMGAVA